MIIYNKVEDVYHTSLRVHTHLKNLPLKQVSFHVLLVLDFIYCFPQYREMLSKKRNLKFLGKIKFGKPYLGAKASHQYLIEKSINGATRLLYSKQIISLENDGVVLLQNNVDIPTISMDEGFKNLYTFIDSNGISTLNDQLKLYESKYAKISTA